MSQEHTTLKTETMSAPETTCQTQTASCYSPTCDYDQKVDRMHTYSMKWEDGPDVLPFWVADMDITCAPAIQEAILQRASSSIYGYTDIPPEWAQAYASWFQSEHHWDLQPAHMVYTNGVICALSSLVRKFSTPAEKIIVLTPVYPIFFNSILNNGRIPLEVPLRFEHLHYSIDFDALESAMQDPQASMMILCNPHNPTGNLWSREDLARIGQLAHKYGIQVVCDEVHGDVTAPGHAYTPYASVNALNASTSLVLLSPSKAFNVAGIHTAGVAAANPILRHKAWRAINTDEVGEPNVFSIQTAVAAYTKCSGWLHGLQAYLFENRRIAEDFFFTRFPDLHPIQADSLYLLWIYAPKQQGHIPELVRFLKDNYGVRLSDGCDFKGNGDTCLRMNLACPRSMLMEGLERLEAGLRVWALQH